MQKLSPEAVTHALSDLPGWRLEDGELTRTWTFPGFVDSISFVDRVAPLAEEAGHHPDIDIRYNKVTLSLTTHDAGGLTSLDTDLASRISREL